VRSADCHFLDRKTCGNLEHGVGVYTLLYPRGEHSEHFQHSEHRSPANIRAGAAGTLAELAAHGGVLPEYARLNFTLHFPDAAKVCGIDGPNKPFRAFPERIFTERMEVCRHFLSMFEALNQEAKTHAKPRFENQTWGTRRLASASRRCLRLVFVFHGGIQALPTGSPLGHSRVKEPENGYSRGSAANPFRTGFIQMYQATDSESSARRKT
jgi:hypothetical protein